MASNFGWKTAVAVMINASALTYWFRQELLTLPEGGQREEPLPEGKIEPNWWMMGIHVLFLVGVVICVHHMVAFLAIFMFFLGWVDVTQEYQEPLKMREGMLVGFFLAGLITLGGFQQWWLQPLLASLGDFPLFLGTTGLTAVTDNAALTFMGSLVELSDASKYALVAGAVAGGGLTVIANAPNPAGFSILKNSFGEEGVSPLGLLLAALLPTLVAMTCFWLLP